jgi:hypothetical protein
MDTPIVPRKRCTKCGEEYAATTDNFHKKVRGLYGLHSWCKRCFYASTKKTSTEWNRTHRVECRMAVARFYQAHKTEILNRQAADYALSPEKGRARAHQWRLLNLRKRAIREANRRALKLGSVSSFTAADIERQIKGQTDKRGRLHCWWCDKVITTFHKDHVHPLSKSLRNDAGNIVISCAHCNLSKHDKTPGEFAGRLL